MVTLDASWYMRSTYSLTLRLNFFCPLQIHHQLQRPYATVLQSTTATRFQTHLAPCSQPFDLSNPTPERLTTCFLTTSSILSRFRVPHFLQRSQIPTVSSTSHNVNALIPLASHARLVHTSDTLRTKSSITSIVAPLWRSRRSLQAP